MKLFNDNHQLNTANISKKQQLNQRKKFKGVLSFKIINQALYQNDYENNKEKETKKGIILNMNINRLDKEYDLDPLRPIELMNIEKNRNFSNIYENSYDKLCFRNYNLGNSSSIMNQKRLKLMNSNNKNSHKAISYINTNKQKKNQYNVGRWSEDEHRRFIEAIMKYGNEWKCVQKHIRTRSSTQSRSHSQKFFLKIRNYDVFDFKNRKPCINSLNELSKRLTEEEKERLLELLISYEYSDENEDEDEDEDENEDEVYNDIEFNMEIDKDNENKNEYNESQEFNDLPDIQDLNDIPDIHEIHKFHSQISKKQVRQMEKSSKIQENNIKPSNLLGNKRIKFPSRKLKMKNRLKSKLKPHENQKENEKIYLFQSEEDEEDESINVFYSKSAVNLSTNLSNSIFYIKDSSILELDKEKYKEKEIHKDINKGNDMKNDEFHINFINTFMNNKQRKQSFEDNLLLLCANNIKDMKDMKDSQIKSKNIKKIKQNEEDFVDSLFTSNLFFI